MDEPKNIMLTERSRHKRLHIGRLHLSEMSRTGISMETVDQWLPGAGSRTQISRKWAQGY